MTDAKAYLKRVKLYDTHIDNKLQELEHLKAMVMKITATWKDDVVSGSRSQDKIGDAVSRIVDLQKEINQDIDHYVDTRNEICDELNKIRNYRHFDILYKRYILYKKWEEIAVEMDFTDVRGVYKLHGRALQTFNRIIKGKNENGH